MSAVKRVDAFWAGGETMTMLDCCRCGMRFGMTQSLELTLRASQGQFYCPIGHQQYFPETETAQQREIRETNARAAKAEHEAAHQKELREWAEKRTRGANVAAGMAKAAKDRVIARVHAGVCPHCNRTFKQLAAHMKSKHGAK